MKTNLDYLGVLDPCLYAKTPSLYKNYPTKHIKSIFLYMTKIVKLIQTYLDTYIR